LCGIQPQGQPRQAAKHVGAADVSGRPVAVSQTRAFLSRLAVRRRNAPYPGASGYHQPPILGSGGGGHGASPLGLFSRPGFVRSDLPTIPAS
jgi:hypothetical protein